MKYTSICLLLLAFIIISCKTEEKEKTLSLGDFEMSKETIEHNQPITITYNGKDKDMEAFYYLLNGYKSYPQDLNFENNKATIIIPDSISAIAFNFKVDGKYLDNNKQGYLFTVMDSIGNIAKGSRSALENYKLGYGKDYGLKGNPKVLIETLDTDITKNPEVKDLWGNRYLSTIIRNDREKGEVIANNMLAEIATKKELKEDDYTQLRSIYMMTKETGKADSITAIAVEKFPKGKIKQQVLMNAFYDAKTLADKEAIFSKLETNFGMTPSMSYAANSIAAKHFKNGNMEAFKNYASKIELANDKAGLYNSVAWPSAEDGTNLELASQLSKQSLDLIKSQQNNLESKPIYYTKKQYKKSLENSYNMYADTYALIQHKLGNTKEAIKYQAEAVGDGKSPDINERYIDFLIADKQYKLASDKANSFLIEGHGTDKMTNLYKTAYSQANPNANNFDAIIADIKQKSHDKKLAELKKDMLDEEAPQFTLKNLDGETISLTSLKGKTVILDFWATWCGPCKASFPGMQEVVKKYENDENVSLLFVDTFEDGKKREENVAKFIKDNKYDFHVLIDDKTKDDRYQVADKYGVTGIPTKVIIGPSGRINFKSVGFNGSNDKLKQEIDLMIELLRTKPKS